jgi:hypothetical protein
MRDLDRARVNVLALVLVCWSIMLGCVAAWLGLTPVLSIALAATVASALLAALFDGLRPRGNRQRRRHG